MAKLITSVGKGADVNGVEDALNRSTLAGKNQPITATTHTISVSDQGEVIEYLNASAIAVTLPTIASVTGSNIHTDDFTVTFKNVGAGAVTITRAGTDTFDDGSTAIVLSQYEYATIQTDSSLTKWNVINHDIDNATKSGTETLTNKKLTSPVINTSVSGSAVDTDATLAADLDTLLASQKAVKAYVDSKMVIASPPEVFTPASTIGSWQTISLSTLSTAAAISATVRIIINTAAGNSTTIRSLEVYVRKTGSGLGLTAATKIIFVSDHRATAANYTGRGSAEFLVELNTNQDFDLYLATNDTGFSTLSAALVSYNV